MSHHNMATGTHADRIRSQWLQGEWLPLTHTKTNLIEEETERGALALIIASAHYSLGHFSDTKEWIQLAIKWGSTLTEVSHMLISSMDHTLGSLAQQQGRHEKAAQHFHDAISKVITEQQKEKIEELVQTRIEIITNKIKYSLKKSIFFQHPIELELTSWLKNIISQVLQSPDIHEATDQILLSNYLTTQEYFLFYLALAEHFEIEKDKTTALHFLNSAREYETNLTPNYRAILVQKYLDLGRADLATDISFSALFEHGLTLPLSENANKKIVVSYKTARAIKQEAASHGHGLLISYLEQYSKKYKSDSPNQTPTLIEIGTTRENIPGQGSTRIIAEFCRQQNFHFITVDMDPHNTRMAQAMFDQIGVPFQAITMKGEDYLGTYPGKFDFIFLDAYDFDHGKHSALRQSRYEKFLGDSITDKACHQMHLDCAHSIVTKLTQNGLVCIDDTWLDNGQWQAKGTLAVPYLLSNQFELIAARNQAILLSRVTNPAATVITPS